MLNIHRVLFFSPSCPLNLSSKPLGRYTIKRWMLRSQFICFHFLLNWLVVTIPHLVCKSYSLPSNKITSSFMFFAGKSVFRLNSWNLNGTKCVCVFVAIFSCAQREKLRERSASEMLHPHSPNKWIWSEITIRNIYSFKMEMDMVLVAFAKPSTSFTENMINWQAMSDDGGVSGRAIGLSVRSLVHSHRRS